MPYEKLVTIYDLIPIDEIKKQVSKTELVVCEVINDFISEVRDSSQDENIHLLSWDQVLMMSKHYCPPSALEMILIRVEHRLHGSEEPSNNTEKHNREYVRREVLAGKGYIFGDPLLKPYCSEGLMAWLEAESVAIWQQLIIDGYPKVTEKVKIKEALISWEAEKKKGRELIVDGTSLELKIQTARIIDAAIRGFGVNPKKFKPGRSIVDEEGNKVIIYHCQLHEKCYELDPDLIPNDEQTFRTERWNFYKKFWIK